MIIVIACTTIQSCTKRESIVDVGREEFTSREKPNEPDQRNDFRLNAFLHAELQSNETCTRKKLISTLCRWQKLLQISRNISHDVRLIKATISTWKESNLHFYINLADPRLHFPPFHFFNFFSSEILRMIFSVWIIKDYRKVFHRKKWKPLKPKPKQENWINLSRWITKRLWRFLSLEIVEFKFIA